MLGASSTGVALGAGSGSLATSGAGLVGGVALGADVARRCPIAYHELMAEMKSGTRLVVLDSFGHLASLEQPDAITRERKTFSGARNES